MKKQVWSLLTALCLVLALLPVTAVAADDEGPMADDVIEIVVTPNQGVDSTTAYYNAEEFSQYLQYLNENAESIGNMRSSTTVTLLNNVTVTVNEGEYAAFSMLRAVLDLNGYTLAIGGAGEEVISGIAPSYGCIIKNGTISVSIPLTTLFINMGAHQLLVENVTVEATKPIEYGIAFPYGQDASLMTFSNCVMNENIRQICLCEGDSSARTQGILLKSGHYSGVPDSLPAYIKIGTVVEGLSGITEGVVYKSDDTTAIIVDDGNAYLYDSLQDAVDAAEPEETIQLLRQPGDQSVTVPTNAYFRIVSFDGASADVGAITFATEEGYQVIVDKDGWVYVEEADIPVTDISLNRTWLTLTKGETAGLTATVSPSNATDKDVTWISSDTAIATVADGTVTAVAPGTATITATAGGESATCTVTVTAAQQPSTPSTSDRDDDDDGYSISVPASSSIRGGSITVSPRRADRDDTVTITVTPDDGYVLDELSVTTRGGDAVSLRQRNDSQYTFEMPAGSVVIHVSFMEQSSTPAEEMFFSDVPSDFWAYNEIQWAFENGYMNGTTSTTFVPSGAVTRQQVWMILARMAGSNPVDMAAARAWAVNNGISDGTDPGAAVTRQQLVALLHRFAAQNGYDTTARADLSGYPDVASVASYAADAMAWSVAEGIVGGTTQGTLNPAGTANRAQFAVILWRFYQTSAN